MDRNDFGNWGIDLSPDDFACALATLGVLLAEPGRFSTWNLLGGARDPQEAATRLRATAAHTLPGPLPWRLPVASASLVDSLEAETMAAGWRWFTAEGEAPRIEVKEFPGTHPFWLVSQLALPSVRARAVYVRADEPAAAVGRDWPMRVGFLDDAPSLRLRDRLEAASSGWLAKITRLVSGTESRCDLLLLPYDLEEALAAVLGRGGAPLAGCTVVLGAAGTAPARAWPLVVALRAATRTSGVALVPAGREAPEVWFREVMRSVSHNEPLDEALSRAAIGEYPAPFLAAARELVDVRMEHRIRKLAERFLAQPRRNCTVTIPSDSAAARAGLSGRHRLEEVAYRLERASFDVGWNSEGDMASVAADVAEAAQAAEPPPLESLQPPPEPPSLRYLHAQVFVAGAAVPQEGAFQPGAPHEVRVFIGAPRHGGGHPADAPFPSRELPSSGEKHRLTVVLTAAGILDQPQVGSIVLPNEGDSSMYTFHLFIPTHLERVEAHIIVMYANRVLQTALLRGSVGEASGARIELHAEARVHAGVSDLAERSRFDAALVLSHTAGGAHAITGAAEGYADFVTSDSLQKYVKVFDDLLTDFGKCSDQYVGPLTNEKKVELLRALARNGAELYKQVVTIALKGGLVAKARRLQVVSVAPDARLPVELFYERTMPDPDAKLCPYADQALRTGACDCPDDGSVVCPTGFWGVTRVLERYAEAPEDYAKPSPFAFRDATERDAWQELEVFGGAVCGWTQRVPKVVEQEVLDAVVSRLAKFCGGAAVVVTEWPALQREVRARQPTLMVLLVHTGTVPNQKHQKAELGTESWLEVLDLDSRYVHPLENAPRPLVLMLGCGTGSPAIDFLGFAAKLREAGAAIAVTAGAAIHGMHAVAAVEQLLSELTELDAKGESFGEVMRRMRANALAEGNLMVLSLASFGDADRKLVPRKAGV